MSVRARLCITLAASLSSVAMGACFRGAEAEGLPCTADIECPPASPCDDGFCGGLPAEGFEPECGNAIVEFGESCDIGDQNGPQAECTLECLLNRCGNGEVDTGEECDDGESNADDAPCTGECRVNVCGDGNRLQGTEECDGAGESASCDADCSLATCGDGTVNPTAGEACDNGMPGVTDGSCTATCIVPIFVEDFEEGSGTWTHAVVEDVSVVGFEDRWARVPSAVTDGGQGFASGPPSTRLEESRGNAGQARLVSPPIQLPSGESLALRFTHEFDFYDELCDVMGDVPAEGSDAAVVEISVDGGPFELLPVSDYDGAIDSVCIGGDGGPPAPMTGEDGFWEHGDDGEPTLETTETDLSAYGGSEIRLGFSVLWDCFICRDQVGPNLETLPMRQPGWGIDDVLIFAK